MKRGVSKKEAARRAWATVNKGSGGGKKSGSGRGALPLREEGGSHAKASRALKNLNHLGTPKI